ncbi:M48 family metallopeptidase [Ferrimonas balearica]|uniref:M48 family metallopeptidase n=1 Tax=Ferrimonas balearica TaxID=44012 RepID=UPI001C571256|nr:M48 family metallopeptidase [Ferrimonas balearica]MBW3138714.1 M48 family metallopeptidase [Ferrimonas balearica]MBY6105775.1 M48 family metallopeptidase [Ferrimonas balearica]
MSQFQNRIPPENNVSDNHPLAEFLGLGMVALLLVVLLTLALVFAGHTLARFVPFSWEAPLRLDWSELAVDEADGKPVHLLFEQVLAADPLPQGLSVRLTVARGDTLNAMAGLGGELLIYQGLVEQLDNDAAVAFVLAHELAHVRHRDPMQMLLSQSLVALSLAALSGNDSKMLELGVMATQLGFSRSQELEADRRAMETVKRLYGDTEGVEQVFELLSQDSALGDWLMTHPDTEARLQQLESFRRRH